MLALIQHPVAHWRRLPLKGRRAILIGLALNELRGLVVVAFVLSGAHHYCLSLFH